jgi:hypothetical protein
MSAARLPITKKTMSRVYDRLESATLLLARGGSIKDRLNGAWRQFLANIEAEDVPREVRLQFLELSSAMQRERPLRGEDAVRATIRKMSNEDAERHAAHIVRMFCKLTRQQELELPVPSPNSAAVVQLFAAEASAG